MRYIQAPLSYPDERKGRLGTVASGETFPHGEPPTPLLIFDAQGLAPNGGWPGRYDAGWSNFYSRYPRRPDLNHILPPYVAEAYTPVKGEGGVVGEAGWFGDARDPNGELLGMPLPAWALGPASAVEIEKRAGKGADPALRKKVA